MENRKAHRFNVVEHLCHFQNAQTIGHELRILFGRYFHAAPQLQIDHMSHLIGDDDHICRTEAVRGIFGNIHTLLHREQGRFTFTLGFLDLLNDESHIIFHGFHKVIRVVVGYRAFGTLFQVLFDKVFCQSVSGGPFCGVLTLLILELLPKHQRGRAVQSTVQSRRRVSCMGAHQSASASARRAA